jgi:hypothetical protein
LGKLHRFHIELALAIVSGLLGFVTIAVPDWFERLTGLNDLDGRTNGFEWVVTAALGAIAVAAALSARAHHRRAPGQGGDAAEPPDPHA